jgi:hypothetical protein
MPNSSPDSSSSRCRVVPFPPARTPGGRCSWRSCCRCRGRGSGPSWQSRRPGPRCGRNTALERRRQRGGGLVLSHEEIDRAETEFVKCKHLGAVYTSDSAYESPYDSVYDFLHNVDCRFNFQQQKSNKRVDKRL